MFDKICEQWHHPKIDMLANKKQVIPVCELLYPPEASGGYFGLASATPPPRVERFSALTL